ncbi:unnamed protein product [Tetraodon nigroviridis]|uniref:Insulin n=1 Tax=Tetraodon nigroviridis TaxID=99883 RepID=Q4T1L5_TETNG|nr:unnamed protein product [Tetraodon nigroviridis]
MTHMGCRVWNRRMCLWVSSVPIQHLCGSQLVDTLYFICGERGFYADGNHPHKRDVEALLGHNEPKVKRGIVEQCCHKPCSIYHLQRYCD